MNTQHRRKKPIDVLQRAIPRNPRYEGVEPVVDSGRSLAKYVEDPRAVFARYKREHELFGRVRCSELARQLESAAENARPAADARAVDADTPPQSPSMSITYIDGEEMRFRTPPKSPLAVDDSCEFLLLDVRDGADFEGCHIERGRSYPSAMLSRAVNAFTPEIHRYKNREDRVIIVYDDDERTATHVATVMFERGVDNVVVLTGGLRTFAHRHPDLIAGSGPPPPPPTPKGRPGTGRGSPSRPGTGRSSTSTARTRPGSASTTRSRPSTSASARAAWK